MGGEIRKGCKVTKLQTADGRVQSLTYEKDGQEYTEEADVFISSMPIKDLAAGMNDVPEEIAAIAEGLPYRDFVTVGLLVDKPVSYTHLDVYKRQEQTSGGRQRAPGSFKA